MNYFWPDVEDSDGAHKACQSAAGVAFFITIVTATVTYLQTTGKINVPGISQAAYIDAGLFALIGIGLIFHSRIAAVIGLLLYIAERAIMMKASGFNPAHAASMVIFIFALVGGVRGAFAWHAHKKTEKDGETPLNIDSTAAPKPKITIPFRAIFLLIVLLAVAAAAYVVLIKKSSLPSLDGLKQKTTGLAKKAVPRKPAAPLVAPKGPPIKLVLKSGRAFDGILAKKDSQGYWVFIDGMGEIFFSVSEVAQASEN